MPRTHTHTFQKSVWRHVALLSAHSLLSLCQTPLNMLIMVLSKCVCAEKVSDGKQETESVFARLYIYIYNASFSTPKQCLIMQAFTACSHFSTTDSAQYIWNVENLSQMIIFVVLSYCQTRYLILINIPFCDKLQKPHQHVSCWHWSNGINQLQWRYII